MSRKTLPVLGLILVAPLVSACGEPTSPTPALLMTLPPIGTQTNPLLFSPSPPAPTPTPVPGQALAQTVTPTPDPQMAVQAAIEALAVELGVPAAEIGVVSTLAFEWSDASLGCPQPGLAYPQVITPGYLVTLAVGDQTYDVHTDLSSTAIVCMSTEGSEGIVTDPIVAEFIAEAKAELSDELRVLEETIALVRSEAVDWSDSSLGCAEPGQSYAEVVTPGYRIILAVDETRYEFHTDQQRMFLCESPTQ